MNKRFIIYKTINNINGKIYIGQHDSFSKKKNYKGSGLLLIKAFKVHGKKNFSLEILDSCDTIDECNVLEIQYIKRFDSTNKNIGYNISYGGDKSIYHVVCEDTRNKISKNKIGIPKTELEKAAMSKGRVGMKLSETHKLNLSKAIKGRKMSKEFCEKISKRVSGENNPMYGMIGEKHPSYGKRGELCKVFGRKHDEETKKKIGESNKGKTVSCETKEKLRKLNLGKKASDNTRLKMSITRMNFPIQICPYCLKESRNIGIMKRMHFEKCKLNVKEKEEVFID